MTRNMINDALSENQTAFFAGFENKSPASLDTLLIFWSTNLTSFLSNAIVKIMTKLYQAISSI